MNWLFGPPSVDRSSEDDLLTLCDKLRKLGLDDEKEAQQLIDAARNQMARLGPQGKASEIVCESFVPVAISTLSLFGSKQFIRSVIESIFNALQPPPASIPNANQYLHLINSRNLLQSPSAGAEIGINKLIEYLQVNDFYIRFVSSFDLFCPQTMLQ